MRTPADSYTVRAVLDNQELDSRASTGTIYWEGLSELFDNNGRKIGRGYLEMTGYAGAVHMVHRIRPWRTPGGRRARDAGEFRARTGPGQRVTARALINWPLPDPTFCRLLQLLTIESLTLRRNQ